MRKSYLERQEDGWKGSTKRILKINDYFYLMIKINKIMKQLHILKGHTRGVICLTSYNGLLYSGSADKTIRSWGNKHMLQILKGHTDEVLCLTVYNGLLYSGSWDGIIRSWKCNSEQYKSLQIMELKYHRINCLTFYKDLLYSGSGI